ncbi:hypothetical protein MPSEU_000810800 [Mayamaea pseudoterrestris]|nr:hypothetical protein MPSEU_000810800 [Mayamaea pseudoterrestris]
MATTMRRSQQCIRIAYLLFVLFVTTANGWQWSRWIQAPIDYINPRLAASSTAMPDTLTLEEIQLMRVRDIRRALTRNHGYSADEVARMIDKVDLIQALANEEKKRQQRAHGKRFRSQVIKALVTAIIGVLVIFCWPLLVQGCEILYINIVVWTDRKRYEVSRCRDLKSILAMVGVILMLVLDLLQFWLTASIALSWIIRRSKYFFPTPQLNVQPGQMLGKEVAGSAIGSMSINIAPMAITWLMRFVHARLEAWTGRAMARALQAQRKAAREKESAEERAARKLMKKQTREQQVNAPSSSGSSTSWMEPVRNLVGNPTDGDANELNESSIRPSTTHDDFLKQIDEAGGMGELD